MKAYILKERQSGRPLREFETIEQALQGVIDFENADRATGNYSEQRYFIEYPERELTINVFTGGEPMNNGRICPNCGREYTAAPAISRKDNKTEICPDCGTLEALTAAGVDTETTAAIMEKIHAAQEQPTPANNYKICFINGHSLKYSEFETAAANREQAQQLFNDRFGAAFDHAILYIYENGACIYDRDKAQQ